jgi:hypothetical protein
LECGEYVSYFDGMLLEDVLLTGVWKDWSKDTTERNSSCDVGIRTAISFSLGRLEGSVAGVSLSTGNRNSRGVSCELRAVSYGLCTVNCELCRKPFDIS